MATRHYIDAGISHGSVLSAILFLLHINDLVVPGTFGYADDSIVSDRYLAGAKCGRSCLVEWQWLIAFTNPSKPISSGNTMKSQSAQLNTKYPSGSLRLGRCKSGHDAGARGTAAEGTRFK